MGIFVPIPRLDTNKLHLADWDFLLFSNVIYGDYRKTSIAYIYIEAIHQKRIDVITVYIRCDHNVKTTQNERTGYIYTLVAAGSMFSMCIMRTFILNEFDD